VLYALSFLVPSYQVVLEKRPVHRCVSIQHKKSIKHKISDDEEELNFKFIKVTFVD